MPSSTPLGIVYPCGGDTITSGVLATYASTTQDALNTTDAIVDDVLHPPAAQLVRPNTSPQSIAAGVTTPVSFTAENYDTDGMWVLGSPTQAVIVSAGTYLASAVLQAANTPTTGLSLRQSILVNGAERAYNKSDSSAVPFGYASPQWVSGLLIALVPGDIITFNALFTGTGNMNIFVTVSITRFSTV